MEAIEFIFWEAVKILGLAFLALFSVKAIAGAALRRAWVKPVLYAAVLGLAMTGAWCAGNDVAAEVYMWTCYSDLDKGDPVTAYENALRAVSLRPASLPYWRALVRSKMRLEQLQSALDDAAALQALNGGKLDEVDDYQFTLCSYMLGRYDDVFATTTRLIRANPSYAAPYVLQGLADIAERRYPEAEEIFLAVLRQFPNHQAAVEGLAHAFYLGGERQKALSVLEQTAKLQFSAPARQRFEALKGLYDQ